MRVLVIGSGGREHAICWKLSKSQRISKLFVAPGNPGMSHVAELVPLKVDDLAGLLEFVKRERIELTVVGPEYPLSLGLGDLFRENGLRIFGPSRAAARLESSKKFAKEVMESAGVATPRYMVFEKEADLRQYLEGKDPPLVLKADGLAAGKGVFVCNSRSEVTKAVDYLYLVLKATSVVVEDYLDGREVSYIVATDGKRVVPMASSHDYKRIFNGDQGGNTGGMGSVSPSPRLTVDDECFVLNKVIYPTLKEMEKRGIPFRGFLYAGLMLTKDKGIQVLEFNCRLGDPETQSLIRRLETDFLDVLDSLSGNGGVSALPEVRWSSEVAVCVVLAARGYPDDTKTGDLIAGLEAASSLPKVEVFQAGTTLNGDDGLVTAGGRVLNVSATGRNTAEACQQVYRAVDLIQYNGKQFRTDIGKNG